MKEHQHHLFRSNDPWTSRKAAKEIEATLGRRMADALERLKQDPGATAAELGGEGVRKRLNDLRLQNLARNGTPRRCRVTGRQAQTWWPAR